MFLLFNIKFVITNFLKVRYELIDFCFEGGDIIHVRCGAKWISDTSSYHNSINKKTFKKAIRYLLENCFLFNLGQEYTIKSRDETQA